MPDVNPLVPHAHKSGYQILLFPLQFKLVKVNLELIGGFSSSLGTNGLIT